MFSRRHITGWPGSLNSVLNPVFRRFAGFCKKDSWLNPVRPLPPVGGNPVLHGVEPDEVNVTMDLRERVGHMLVLGTTRVGKTRLAEVLITQDIRRGEYHDCF